MLHSIRYVLSVLLIRGNALAILVSLVCFLPFGASGELLFENGAELGDPEAYLRPTAGKARIDNFQGCCITKLDHHA